MVSVYVSLIKKGLRTLQSVPASIRDAVAAELEAQQADEQATEEE